MVCWHEKWPHLKQQQTCKGGGTLHSQLWGWNCHRLSRSEGRCVCTAWIPWLLCLGALYSFIVSYLWIRTTKLSMVWSQHALARLCFAWGFAVWRCVQAWLWCSSRQCHAVPFHWRETLSFAKHLGTKRTACTLLRQVLVATSYYLLAPTCGLPLPPFKGKNTNNNYIVDM